ncbi:hypothetical protein LTR36_010229 [Oleoguttula mirabilis]|uniref:Uncharacterized protein n=1 Tax=Oleoguttula mirabilis TaxID=1507867 RepID=A0AAV9JSB9_9PEZI|nr:hypothetical protein LTR36_010229 [Oleoguttula mirabilis]
MPLVSMRPVHLADTSPVRRRQDGPIDGTLGGTAEGPVLPPLAKAQSEEAPKASKRKRSSILNFFHKSALTDSTYEAPNSGIVGTSPPVRPPPGIFLISPLTPQVTPQVERKMPSSMSDGVLPSYFVQPRLSDTSDDNSSTSLVSPISPAGGTARTPGHSRSSTEDLSPFTQPRSRPRLRHRHTLANMDEDGPAVLSATPSAPAVLSGAAAGHRERYMSSDGQEYNKTMLTGPGALDRLPPEMRRVTTPPEKEAGPAVEGKKRSIFQQFLLDLRNTSSEQTKADPDTPGPAADQRQPGLALKGSIVTLLHRASKPQLNKLKRNVSQATVSTARYTPPLSSKQSLEVTDFHQTPYGQRYGNARRAEMNQIRTYVEDALNEDGDEDLELGFELDVPEHLPNSPLCPLDPRHKSGGKAICPLHGRKKRVERLGTTFNKVTTKTAGKVTIKPKPQIVYEGKVESWVDAPRLSSEEGAVGKKQRMSMSSDGGWYS